MRQFLPVLFRKHHVPKKILLPPFIQSHILPTLNRQTLKEQLTYYPPANVMTYYD